MNAAIRIEEVRKVVLNGKQVKLFKAYRLNEKGDAYVFAGEHAAPAKTANKNLAQFIDA